MFIAVVGCCHGELDRVYETMAECENFVGRKVDLLLICGDFQAVRNEDDLECLACPPKYRQMNSFYKYYSGEKKAPVLTIVIGGNHEASNHMQELPFGGFLAPNIYYLGYAGVINVGGLRIAGLSGIFDRRDYNKPHYESPPYNGGTMRSVYHVRREDVERLKKVREPVDIFLSHDWPTDITKYGDLKTLLRKKSFLRDDINSGKLGSPALRDLLFQLKPKYFFSAHLHAKFPAIVQHEDQSKTLFLALSKPLPGQDFMQVLDLSEAGIIVDRPIQVQRDLEWLTILKMDEEADPFKKNKILSILGHDRLNVPAEAFEQTARAYNPKLKRRGVMPSEIPENRQTTSLVSALGLDNFWLRRPQGPISDHKPQELASTGNNPEEIALDLDSN